MIPMVDLARQIEPLKEEFEAVFRSVLAGTRFILGPEVAAFEQEVAARLDVQAAVSCASGTDALHLALRAAGVGSGDEVITSPFTFIATAEAIRYVGARPVFVDINSADFNIAVDQIEAAITSRTRAIIPVHLFGQAADMDAIGEIAARHRLLVIEDAAQAFGATVGERPVGGIGAFGCFSFFPSKNLGAFGDGGLVTTQCPSAAETLRVLRNHGSRVRYHHEVIGFNSRLDEFQAGFLRVHLRHIDDFNAQRRRVAERYSQGLAGLPLTLPSENGLGLHVYHQYTLMVPEREPIQRALDAAGIAHAIYYPIPLHLQTALRDPERLPPSLPRAEYAAQHCLSLPVFPTLRDDEVDQICAVIREALRA